MKFPSKLYLIKSSPPPAPPLHPLPPPKGEEEKEGKGAIIQWRNKI